VLLVISNRAHAANWHAHPKLKGRFLVKHGNQLHVIAHEGGPQLTARRPELLVVEVIGCEGEVFLGRVKHQPIQLQTVQLGGRIRFLVPAGSRYPVLVTEKYLQERSHWNIGPCSKCGFSELFDAPSELIRILFPHSTLGVSRGPFKIPCPLCNGLQRVSANTELREPHAITGKRRAR